MAPSSPPARRTLHLLPIPDTLCANDIGHVCVIHRVTFRLATVVSYGKLFQRLLALIVGQQKLTAQIIPIWLCHRFNRRGVSPKLVYTISENALGESLWAYSLAPCSLESLQRSEERR